MLSRRAFLAFASALALAPRRARAADAEHRKFLFLFARGGWDPTFVFAPDTDPTYVDGDPEGRTSEAGGIRFVDASSRPAVRSFFTNYGHQTCILNGIEVRSLTHERCRRLILCGGGEGEADDWAATLAANTAPTTLPHLVLGGPAFTARYASSVVRTGGNNQLSELLSGAHTAHGPPGMRALSADRSERAAAFARARAEAWAAARGEGQARDWSGDLLRAYDQLDLAREISDRLETDGVGSEVLVSVPDQLGPALRCFSEGISRCAMLEHLGLYDLTWDSHSGVEQQSDHYELLFTDLAEIAQTMETTAGTGGGSLLDETTVLVFSEMGRTPRLNAALGKDHWTFTSAMLFGAGVRGGQVIGGYSGGMVGDPVDLATGGAGDTALVPEHLGATLYAIAGLDPAALGTADPIDAAIEGA